MNKEITAIDDLLDKHGELKHPGFSKNMVQIYDRSKIKANQLRIKEWDYYLIYNKNFGIALTIDDNSYMGMSSVSFLDFKNKSEHTESRMKLMTKGKVKLPSSSASGDLEFKTKDSWLKFSNNGDRRVLAFKLNKFGDEVIEGIITLSERPDESMVIMTPFNKPKHFYYNQKIVGFAAEGEVNVGGKTYKFLKDDTRAILDWGRGVWTYKNTWYWGGACFKQNEHEIGFNIGYGFGDTSHATENMLFFDGKAHKLDEVRFNIPQDESGKEEYTKPWTFNSNDGRFEMDFVPILDRHADTNLLLIRSLQHQVFGYYTGSIVLDDGTKIKIKKQLGFAEKVTNKW